LAGFLERRQDGLPIILGGFSQGAMMTLSLLALSNVALAGAIILSGAPLLLAPLDDLQGLPVFVSHGLEDDVLPADGADMVDVILESANARLESHRYPIGHGVDMNVLEDLDRWMRGVLATQTEQ
jgi:phospholipase/carboxylesterase